MPDYPAAPSPRSPFVVTSYIPDCSGVPTAVVPSLCPQGTAVGSACCAVTIDHLRHRKSGPQHPLAVARCSVHGLGFTLYPLGYAPYRRQQVLKLAPDGTADRAGAGGLREEFERTVFDAALDGAEGRPWARDSDDEIPDRWWSTQGRHLRLAARLLGMIAPERLRDRIAAALSVSGLRQREGAVAKGFRAVSTAICGLLSKLRGAPAARAYALLVCGHLAGHWGEPMRWDRAREDLIRSPFCAPGTRGHT